MQYTAPIWPSHHSHRHSSRDDASHSSRLPSLTAENALPAFAQPWHPPSSALLDTVTSRIIRVPPRYICTLTWLKGSAAELQSLLLLPRRRRQLLQRLRRLRQSTQTARRPTPTISSALSSTSSSRDVVSSPYRIASPPRASPRPLQP